MRVVDADKLIEHLRLLSETKPLPAIDKQLLGFVEEVINGESTANDWIPVERALPEEPKVDYETSDEMLCAVYQGRDIYYEICRYNFDDKIWRNGEYIPRNVIAWKPIEPYEVNND